MAQNVPIRVLLAGCRPEAEADISRTLTAVHGASFTLKIFRGDGTVFDSPDSAQTDIILLDISPWEAQKKNLFARIREKAPHLPVVLVSTPADEAQAETLLQSGAQDFILREDLKTALAGRMLRYVAHLYSQEEQLRQNEERYRMMIEHSSDIITLLDKEGRIIFENPSIERMFGYRPDELEGKHIFDFVHPDERIQVMEKFKKSMEQKILNENIEFRFLTKAGTWRFLEAIGSTVFDETHGLIAVINSRDVTQRVEAQKKLFSMTIDDPLTGLLNRRGFLMLCDQQLKLSKRTKQGSCLIYADVDGLKEINDRYGHAEGDKLLMEVSQLLKKSFREPDVIARLGGDEFVILAISAEEIHASVFMDRIKENLKARSENVRHPYKLSLSAGVVYVDPRHQTSIDDLLSRADMLMYQQKQLNQKSSL